MSACDNGASQKLAECRKTTTELSEKNTQLTGQIDNLNAQISNLMTENQELAQTPARRLVEISDLVAKRDEIGAQAALQALKQAYPSSMEVTSAEGLLSSLQTKLREEREAAERQERLGFRALKELRSFEGTGLKLNLSQAQIADKWLFDDYGNAHFYRDATRDNRFVVARVAITANPGNKDPRLPGFGVYTVSGKKLVLLARMEYRFSRWDDYGSYLGNEADFKNDFEYTATIPFTLGAEVAKSDLQKPLFLLAARTPCMSRLYERFENPPVSYRGFCDALKGELSLDEALSNTYVLVKSWNFQ